MGDFTTAGEVESVTAHEVINNNQDNIYVVHQGKVDRINMPGGQRRTIIDLDAMGRRKEKSGLEITGYL